MSADSASAKVESSSTARAREACALEGAAAIGGDAVEVGAERVEVGGGERAQLIGAGAGAECEELGGEAVDEDEEAVPRPGDAGLRDRAAVRRAHQRRVDDEVIGRSQISMLPWSTRPAPIFRATAATALLVEVVGVAAASRTAASASGCRRRGRHPRR